MRRSLLVVAIGRIVPTFESWNGQGAGRHGCRYATIDIGPSVLEYTPCWRCYGIGLFATLLDWRSDFCIRGILNKNSFQHHMGTDQCAIDKKYQPREA